MSLTDLGRSLRGTLKSSRKARSTRRRSRTRESQFLVYERLHHLCTSNDQLRVFFLLRRVQLDRQSATSPQTDTSCRGVQHVRTRPTLVTYLLPQLLPLLTCATKYVMTSHSGSVRYQPHMRSRRRTHARGPDAWVLCSGRYNRLASTKET